MNRRATSLGLKHTFSQGRNTASALKLSSYSIERLFVGNRVGMIEYDRQLRLR